VDALGLAPNTIIVFHSDNGGPVSGEWEGEAQSSNYPLRGGKFTLWQGGVKATALVAGPGVPAGSVVDAPVHVTDWLPTLVAAATGGGDFRQWAPPGEPPYQEGDGVDVWDTVTGAARAPQRKWVLLEVGAGFPAPALHGHGLIVGDMKLVAVTNRSNNPLSDGWFPPPGQDVNATPYTTRCGAPLRNGTAAKPCVTNRAAPALCLFNLTADPCEYNDVSEQFPDVLKNMSALLGSLALTATHNNSWPSGCLPAMLPVSFPDGSKPAHWWLPCDAPAPPA